MSITAVGHFYFIIMVYLLHLFVAESNFLITVKEKDILNTIEPKQKKLNVNVYKYKK